MSDKNDNRVLIHEKEAAKYLGIGYHGLRLRRAKETKTGKFPIPFVRVMDTVRYDVADLDAYLKSVTYTPKGEEK